MFAILNCGIVPFVDNCNKYEVWAVIRYKSCMTHGGFHLCDGLIRALPRNPYSASVLSDGNLVFRVTNPCFPVKIACTRGFLSEKKSGSVYPREVLPVL